MATFPKYKLDIDMKALNGLAKRLQDLNQKEIQYGYFDDVYPASDPRGRAGMHVAEVAWKNETGFDVHWMIMSPPRPFFTQSLAKAKWFVTTSAPAVYKLAFEGKMGKSFVQMGKWLADSVRETIDEQNFAQNRPMTRKIKGEDKKILEDTGMLYDSVKAKIINNAPYGNRKGEVDI